MLLVFWPGEFHGLYSPWGHEESDTTEQLSLSFTVIQGFAGGKESTCNAEDLGLVPGDLPLEEGMVTHCSILAWRIPRTEEPGGLQSMGVTKSQT